MKPLTSATRGGRIAAWPLACRSNTFFLSKCAEACKISGVTLKIKIKHYGSQFAKK